MKKSPLSKQSSKTSKKKLTRASNIATGNQTNSKTKQHSIVSINLISPTEKPMFLNFSYQLPKRVTTLKSPETALEAGQTIPKYWHLNLSRWRDANKYQDRMNFCIVNSDNLSVFRVRTRDYSIFKISIRMKKKT